MKSLMAPFAVPGDAELTRAAVTPRRWGGTAALKCQQSECAGNVLLLEQHLRFPPVSWGAWCFTAMGRLKADCWLSRKTLLSLPLFDKDRL